MFRDNNSAVSPVMAVILLVAVTVGLSAVIGGFALNLGQSTTSESAQNDVGITTTHASGNVTATIVTGSADKVKLIVNGSEVNSIENASAGDTLTAPASAGSDVTVVTVTDGSETVATSTTIDDSEVSTTGSNGPTLTTISDTFNDNSFNTSKWTKVTPGNATVTEENGVIKLLGGGYSSDRPYFRTNDEVNNGTHGNNVTVTANARLLNPTATDAPQFFIPVFWDGNVSGSYSTPQNGIVAGAILQSNEFRIYKAVNGTQVELANASAPAETGYHNYTVEATGSFDSMDIVLKYDGSTVVTATNVTFNPSNPTPYVGYYGREQGQDTYVNNTTVTVER